MSSKRTQSELGSSSSSMGSGNDSGKDGKIRRNSGGHSRRRTRPGKRQREQAKSLPAPQVSGASSSLGAILFPMTNETVGNTAVATIADSSVNGTPPVSRQSKFDAASVDNLVNSLMTMTMERFSFAEATFTDACSSAN